MGKLIVLDWRNFVKNVSFSILNGQIACTWPTEQEEVAHRIFKRLYCLRLDHQDGRFVIANDVKPYWRTGYLAKWYGMRPGTGEVVYKGNREGAAWPFKCTPAEMEAVYAKCRFDAAKCLGGIIAQDEGLEADDIWGIISSKTTVEVVGISGDSDWAQCITPDTGRVKLFDFTKNTWVTEKADIRIKWIGGDSGDGVKGCTKLKKDGTPSTKGWGHDGAEKLLREQPDNWMDGLSKQELEKNWMVVTLPCPTWDLEESEQALLECSKEYALEECWDEYGITEGVRKKLAEKVERDAWSAKLRMHFAALKAGKAEEA